MPTVNALSLTSVVNAWLRNSQSPRILHVFDRACNLINERGEVLSIVTPEIGNGPFNLLIPRLRKSFRNLPDLNASRQTSAVFSVINLQSPVSVSSDQLHLGNLTVSVADAKLWNPRPDWEKLHSQKEKILARLMRLPITNYSSPISQFSNSLIAALASADLPASLSVAQRLAGLGIGLTPSGDDFIMGVVYASWIIHPHEAASILGEEIANTAAPLTTSLSAAWLRSAGKGEAGISWHELFDALITANPVRIQQAIGKILAVGETSGADALTGFVGTMLCWGSRNS